jgi:cytochrome c oxidase cbb3-type subunit I/II
MSFHRDTIEPRSVLMAVLTTVMISIGGLVEIVPLFTSAGPPPMAGIEPLTPLEVAGRDIYLREGCYTCHSQMVRPFRSETLRYGPWSRGGEYVYDHPFQLGSKRTGPDLARVGGKYPDSWHFEHLMDARQTSDGSIMPTYAWLNEWTVDPADVQASVTALSRVGVPYTDDDIANVPAALAAQAGPIADGLTAARYETAPDREVIAVIAYLQQLGVNARATIDAEQANVEGAR